MSLKIDEATVGNIAKVPPSLVITENPFSLENPRAEMPSQGSLFVPD